MSLPSSGGPGLKDHWDAIQFAREGDVVLSHADGQVRAVSRVTRTAYPAMRPDPEADREWSNDGRRVEVEYRDLETRLPVAAIPEGRRQEEGGPFDRDGGVKQGYFFPLSDAFVNVIRGLSPELGALLPTGEETVTLVVGTRYEEPDFHTISDAVLEQGMALTQRTIRRYHLSLKSRGFVVLSGVSGTGKTWLAQAYARAVGAEFLVVPVAPNWTTNEDLLGYRSPIDNKYRETPFSLFLRKASDEWTRSARENRPAQPFHVILDEMNLARVEYYFAKFLSAMELRQREGEVEVELAPGDVVRLGPNLLFIGTVNIDETTHLFADKVFDRAQLVELDIDRAALEAHVGQQPYATTLLGFWDALREVAPFAYRIVDEIGVYIGHADQLGVGWKEALDEQVFQKLLPKLKGADPRVGTALERFIELAGDDCPLSRRKAEAMHESFVQHGFSSYF
jgi:MoxR-like ATPase